MTKKIDDLSSVLLSSASSLHVQSQSQQMNDAMVISTMRGTEWRILEERDLSNKNNNAGPIIFGKNSPKQCKSIATFSGFVSDTNKGTVTVKYLCGGDKNGRSNDDDTNVSDTIATPTNASSLSTNGRWVTKPSRISRGSIQLSARWKVKLPTTDAAVNNDGAGSGKGSSQGGGTIIYKGNIEASKMIGRNGKSVEAEITGLILTGAKVNEEKVIGKFTGDFIRKLPDEEVDAIKISGGMIYSNNALDNGNINNNEGPITLVSPTIK